MANENKNNTSNKKNKSRLNRFLDFIGFPEEDDSDFQPTRPVKKYKRPISKDQMSLHEMAKQNSKDNKKRIMQWIAGLASAGLLASAIGYYSSHLENNQNTAPVTTRAPHNIVLDANNKEKEFAFFDDYFSEEIHTVLFDGPYNRLVAANDSSFHEYDDYILEHSEDIYNGFREIISDVIVDTLHSSDTTKSFCGIEFPLTDDEYVKTVDDYGETVEVFPKDSFNGTSLEAALNNLNEFNAQYNSVDLKAMTEEEKNQYINMLSNDMYATGHELYTKGKFLVFGEIGNKHRIFKDAPKDIQKETPPKEPEKNKDDDNDMYRGGYLV